MKKILNFGSLNVDMVYSLPHFVRPGETLAATKMELFPGGKGLNQSVALSRAGAEVYHGGKIAPDGKWLSDFLKERGADTRFVSMDGSATGTAVIQVPPSGENCIIINHGANYEITKEEIDKAFSLFEKGDLLLLQNEINLIPYLIETAYNKGMDVVLNPSPIDDELLKLDLSHVKYILLNEIEGEAFTKEKEPEKILKALSERYPGLKIVLTLGKDGAVYKDGDKLVRQNIYKVKAVDTTAAGDSFTGFFLASICEGKTVEEALSTAAKASAIAVSRMGAASSVPTMEEVKNAQLEEAETEVN